MLTRHTSVRQLELCDPTVFGDLVLTCQSPPLTPDAMPFIPDRLAPKVALTKSRPKSPVKTIPIQRNIFKSIQIVHPEIERRRTSALVDQLLVDIYNHANSSTDYNSATSSKSQRHYSLDINTIEALQEKGIEELQALIITLHDHVGRIGSILVRQLKRRDALRRQREAHCDVITIHLRKHSEVVCSAHLVVVPVLGRRRRITRRRDVPRGCPCIRAPASHYKAPRRSISTYLPPSHTTTNTLAA
ncbi:hypothetical protein QE152_g33225 [Popillia japonica]|uniref:Uncharacterized protein n=1 Tax=Popillia japonica TaxID=7064 RepID=A0AAW1IXQ6_POPJA